MIEKLDDKDIGRLGKRNKSIRETIKEHERDYEASADNKALLMNCENDWSTLRDMREKRRRNMRYRDGDQWGDTVTDPDTGKPIREDRLISKSGKIPMKHNLIMQYFRNIHGQMLSNPTQTVVHARSTDESDLSDMLTNTVQANHQVNKVSILDKSILDELLLAGIGVTKIGYRFWHEKDIFDATVDLVNTNRFFFNPDANDPRLFDIRRIGELHDYTLDELLVNFSESGDDDAMLCSMYSSYQAYRVEYSRKSEDMLGSMDFSGIATCENKIRIIEVWEKKRRKILYCHDYLDGTVSKHHGYTKNDIKRINDERIELAASMGINADNVRLIYAKEMHEMYWQVKFLTTNGVCLKEMETPYAHQSHPYVFATMPMTDGKIVAVMNDLIDIQRYINRLVVMIDFIMGASAKGVLLVPEECIPDGYTIDDFAKAYVRTNGVIMIAKNATGRMPQQVSANATNIGAWDMLRLEMDLINKIAGLSGAVQGQVAKAGTAASLYAQQAQNSMLNYLLVFDMHGTYCEDRDEKLLKVIMQYYDEPRYVDINNKSFNQTAKKYIPEMAKKVINFNMVARKSMNTAVYRELADAMLFDMMNAGRIPLEVYFNNSSVPFSEKLLNDLKAYNEQMKNGQIEPERLDELREQAETNADPRATNLLQKFINSDEEITTNTGTEDFD